MGVPLIKITFKYENGYEYTVHRLFDYHKSDDDTLVSESLKVIQPVVDAVLKSRDVPVAEWEEDI